MMPFKYENRKAKSRTTVHVAHSLRSIFQKFFGKVPPPSSNSILKYHFKSMPKLSILYPPDCLFWPRARAHLWGESAAVQHDLGRKWGLIADYDLFICLIVHLGKFLSPM